MSQCSIEVCDDDSGYVMRWTWKRSLSFSVKSLDIPPTKENEFWKAFHMIVDCIFNHHEVVFRGVPDERPSLIVETGNLEYREDHRTTVENAKDIESIKEKSLLCLLCIFNTEIVRLSSINQLFESDIPDTMEYVLNLSEQMNASPFRLPLYSSGSASDSFAKALEDVRETFVSSSYFSNFNARHHEELKRDFDLKQRRAILHDIR